MEISREARVDALVFLQKPQVTDVVTSRTREAIVSERAAYVTELRTKTESIQQTALQSMAPLVTANQMTVKQSYYIDNILYVSLTQEALTALTRIPGVRAITPNYQFPVPQPETSITASQWNIAKIAADQAWSTLGIRGVGAVVANIDTGVRWDHNAVKQVYRGWLGGGSIQHNYNWFDPTGTYPTAPGDNNGHGTHTMGTMIGGTDPNYVIGVAPDAKWIAAKGCESSSCSSTSLLAAAQWILAPTALDGSSPNPAMAPDVVNNSWGGGSCSTWFSGVIDSWKNAGIVPVFSQGNSGPNPGSANSPGDNPQAIGVGATDSNDVIASFSSRGPSCPTFGSEIKPEVSAPGVNILSSVPNTTNSYSYYSGTSMAAPHVAGTVALLRSAKPSLTVDEIETILKLTSVDKGTTGPDNDYGAGRINTYGAVNAAVNGGSISGTVTKQADNTPLSGANALLVKQFDASYRREVTTESDGTFQFPFLEPNTYVFYVSSYGYITFSQPFPVTPKQQLTVPVTLTKAPSYTLTGVVTNPGGLPISATVTLLNTPVPPTSSDPVTGAYTLTDIPSNVYMLQVSSPGFQMWKGQITINNNTTKNVQLGGLPSIPLINGFENGFSGWTPTGLWNVLSAPNYCSNPKTGTKSAYYGSPITCNFNVGLTRGELTSPLFYIPNAPGSVSMDFWSWYETESSGTYWDKRIVEIKEEFSPWTTLHQLSGDPMKEWQPLSLPMDAYKGKNVQVRFVFDSVDSTANQYRGWYIDDVNIGVHGANLFISQTGPDTAEIGTTIHYALSIANLGDRAAENTVLTDTFSTPEGNIAQLISITDAQGSRLSPNTQSSGSFTISFGSLAPGATTSATVDLTISETAKRTQKVTNTGTLTTTTNDIDPTNNTSTRETVIISTELDLTGLDTVLDPSNGTVKYTFTLKNIGELPATNVTSHTEISAPFPWQLTTTSSNAAASPEETSSGSFDITFGTLTPNETVSYAYTVKPIGGATGSFDVTATATTDAKESYTTNSVHITTPINTIPTPTPTPKINTPPKITTTSLPNAIVRKSYNTSVSAIDVDADTLKMTFTNLPLGLTQGPCTGTAATDGQNQMSCIIQGTPRATGTFSVAVTVLDSQGAKVQQRIPLKVVLR